jgi:hypothetical protein
VARGRTLSLKVEAEVKGAEKLDALGKKLSKTGANLTAAFTVPLLAGGAAAFKFASDLDEASTKAAQVFTTQAGKIEKAAQNLDDAFSEATFKDTAGTFGALLQQMGLTEEKAADLSLAWLGLAQDMASFHNTKPEEALAAIQSALSGEFEPLKRYGVMLNVAAIEQKALEMGIWDGVGAISAQARALVINEELFAKQSKVVGDFARTSGGAANSTRQLVANFTDAAASIGQELLPAGTALLKTVNGWIKGFKSLSPETRGLIVQVGVMAAALGPVLFVVGKLVSAFTLLTRIAPAVVAGSRLIGLGMHAMLGPLGLVTAGVAGLATAFATDFLGVRSRFERDMEDIGGALDFVADRFRRDFGIIEEETTRVFSATSSATTEWTGAQKRAYADMTAATTAVVTGMADEISGAPQAMADALLADQFKPLSDAIDELNAFTATAVSPAVEIFRAQGFLNSDEYANALGSPNPLVVQKANELAAQAKAAIERNSAYNSGKSFSSSFAYGMVDAAALRTVVNSAYKVALAARGIFPGSEPKDPRSPFRGITKAFGMMDVLAAGITKTSGVIPMALAGAMAAPQFGNAGMSRPARSAGVAGMAGNVTNVNLTVQGDLRAKSPEEVVQTLQRLAPLVDGKLAPGW